MSKLGGYRASCLPEKKVWSKQAKSRKTRSQNVLLLSNFGQFPYFDSLIFPLLKLLTRFGGFINTFEQISRIAPVFLLFKLKK